MPRPAPLSLVHRFRRHLEALALPGGRALVAVSGGPDSLALLDLLLETREAHGLELVVAHLDHGIAPESARIAERVRELALVRGLAVRVGRLALGPQASETLARARRYAWLEEVRRETAAGLILTAHHADDQAETVLLRVLEGSGPAGLAAMAPRRGAIVRPLLPFRRAELLGHLEERGIGWWADPGNADPRHLRSWVRTAILPALRTRLPEVDARLGRVAAQAAAERAAWDAALGAMPGLDFREECDGVSVAAPLLAGYDSPLAEALLRAAARRAGLVLGPGRAADVRRLAAGGRSGSEVPLGHGWRAEVRFGRLHLVRVPDPVDAPEPVPLDWMAGDAVGDGAGERRWGEWSLRWRREPAPATQARRSATAWFAPRRVRLRPWRPGDRVRPLGGVGGRLVVRCLQEARVPKGRRAAWPVLVTADDDTVLWVPGVCRSDSLIPPEGTEAVRVDAVDLTTG
ncbi:MAG TPA: tRNA lysidine(34) synthetase TilS [Gemmatimonadales bacterium]|nr:tRNA lysidine(34) synthetase TilS [Gemmatimonadales bacterium]